MSASLTALLGFAAWTLLLVAVVVFYRVGLVFTFKRPANSWTRGEKHEDPAIITRFAHAHANCLETLPVFAVVVLVAMNVEGGLARIDPLAPYVLYLRLAQSLTHLVGTSALLVFVRAGFYTGQIALLVWMMLRLWA